MAVTTLMINRHKVFVHKYLFTLWILYPLFKKSITLKTSLSQCTKMSKVFDQLLNKTIRIRHLTKINLHIYGHYTHLW